jgi:hypothetical protein
MNRCCCVHFKHWCVIGWKLFKFLFVCSIPFLILHWITADDILSSIIVMFLIILYDRIIQFKKINELPSLLSYQQQQQQHYQSQRNPTSTPMITPADEQIPKLTLHSINETCSDPNNSDDEDITIHLDEIDPHIEAIANIVSK